MRPRDRTKSTLSWKLESIWHRKIRIKSHKPKQIFSSRVYRWQKKKFWQNIQYSHRICSRKCNKLEMITRIKWWLTKTTKVMKINNMRTLRNKKISILIVRAQQLKHTVLSKSTLQIKLLSTKNSSYPTKTPKNSKFLLTSNKIKSNQVLTHMAPNQWRASIPKNNIIRKAQSMDPMRSLLYKRWTRLSAQLKKK